MKELLKEIKTAILINRQEELSMANTYRLMQNMSQQKCKLYTLYII